MLKWGHAYVDKGLQYYEECHRQQQVHCSKQANKLGFQIVEPQSAAPDISHEFLEETSLEPSQLKREVR
jgi:hypothetical protein